MSPAAISKYQILELLGEGGMGRVYKARDPQLGRLLAIKVLLADAASAGDRRARFLQEARSASALNHPNIVTIYEVGQDSGVDFIAMEYLEGQPLDRAIREGGLTTEGAVEIAVQIADALAKAHAEGILHRDLKPANIFLTVDGLVKVLDFGLAKQILSSETASETQSMIAATSPVTRAGVLMGTVAYMSPEQAEGLPLDHRSDIFSFGSMLYEMVTGRRAFDGVSQISVLTKVIRDDPAPAPPPLGDVIAKCMRKSPPDRYPSFADVRAALREAVSGGPSVTAAVTGAGSAMAATPGIAVLPFADLSTSHDQEFLCDGLAEEIINSLSRLKNLRVAARTSAFMFKGRSEDVRRIGQQLNVGLVLEGSVRVAGSRLRVSVQLVDTREGLQISSQRYDRDLTDIFAIQDEIAAAVTEELRQRFDMQPVSAESPRPVANIEAYSLYLRGRHAWARFTPEALQEAMNYYQQALAIEPNYALAWSGMADTQTVIASFGYLPPHQIYPLARTSARKALELEPTLPEAHISMGAIRGLYEWDWRGAEESFATALRFGPARAEAHYALGLTCLAPQRRFDEARESLRMARALDPLNIPKIAASVHNELLAGRLDAAREILRTVPAEARAHPVAASAACHLAFLEGDLASSYAEAEAVLRAIPNYPTAISWMGCCQAAAGDVSAAEQRLGELDEMARHRYVQQYDAACILACLGRKEEALNRLRLAFEAHDGGLMFVASDRKLAGLWDEPQFKSLLESIGLPSALAAAG